MLTLYIKGFHQADDGKFKAIVPLWNYEAATSGEKPVDHKVITGIAVRAINFHQLTHTKWHPDNPYSDEKWIELELLLCRWSYKNDQSPNVLERETRLGNWHEICGQAHPTWRFLAPASQLRPVVSLGDMGWQVGDFAPRSKDRAKAQEMKYQHQGPVYTNTYNISHAIYRD